MNNAPINLDLLRTYLEQVSHRGRTMLLPVLHQAQEWYGWLPREVLDEVSRGLNVPAAEVHGVVEFYSMFYNQPTPRRIIRVCQDSACQLANADAIEQDLHCWNAMRDPSEKFAVERVACLGLCEAAPAVLDGEEAVGGVTLAGVQELIAGSFPKSSSRVFGTHRLITRRFGYGSPGSLDDYLASGGYQVLQRVTQESPENLIAAIEQSNIVGRGGAMFPLGQKWRFTRSTPGSPGSKHIVINADESEPGTFKDRYILEQDPFSVIESAALAAYAAGAANGWIFIRGEYPASYKQVQKAVDLARKHGYLGKDILGVPGFDFDIEVRLGAGAYICGEETALFEAIEGKRGFPRIKPPFPTVQGLFNQPTAINNVETLVAALTALEIGLDTWNQFGKGRSRGTKLFCLSGHVGRPGLYEVPFGLTIRELISLAGGGNGEKIQAVLLGGAAGSFVGPDELDIPLTYEDFRDRKLSLGSGVIMVFNETADLRKVLFELARFFAHESCGKCFPCQLGTMRQVEILERIAISGSHLPGDEQSLNDLATTMTLSSLCGLGQTAASAIQSAIFRWPELIK